MRKNYLLSGISEDGPCFYNAGDFGVAAVGEVGLRTPSQPLELHESFPPNVPAPNIPPLRSKCLRCTYLEAASLDAVADDHGMVAKVVVKKYNSPRLRATACEV
jgi:hypothetical protein